MSGISRIDKFVRETSKLPSLSAAADARQLDVTIRLGAGCNETTEIIARTLVALALRCCTGRLHLLVNPADLSDAARDRIIAVCLNECEAYGATERLAPRATVAVGLKITVGAPEPGWVSTWAQGWSAYLNLAVADPHKTAGVPAMVFAASAAMAKCFSAEVLGADYRVRSESWSFNVLLHQVQDIPMPPDTAPIPLGKLALLGGGAIGSAVMYTLFHSNIEAAVEIIDYDAYDNPNKETTLLIRPDGFRFMLPKAKALADQSRRPGLTATEVIHKVIDGDLILQKARDVFIVGVDNAATRRLLDHVQSPLLINAALGGNSADSGHLLVSHHRSGSPSLSSLFPEDETSEAVKAMPAENAECSHIAYQQASLAAPFMSAGAGSLIVAGLVARVLGLSPKPYLKMDLLGLQRHFTSR